jgi:DNA gyrase subunit A
VVTDETGVLLASRNAYVIHFPVDQVNVLSGVGKGVIGIKLDGDVCLGGELVTSGVRKDATRLFAETESGRTEDFTYERPKSQNRGGKGDKQGVRTKFARVVPPEIQLVNWDEVEGKKPSKNGHANGHGNGNGG